MHGHLGYQLEEKLWVSTLNCACTSALFALFVHNSQLGEAHDQRGFSTCCDTLRPTWLSIDPAGFWSSLMATEDPHNVEPVTHFQASGLPERSPAALPWQVVLYYELPR